MYKLHFDNFLINEHDDDDDKHRGKMIFCEFLKCIQTASIKTIEEAPPTSGPNVRNRLSSPFDQLNKSCITGYKRQ